MKFRDRFFGALAIVACVVSPAVAGMYGQNLGDLYLSTEGSTWEKAFLNQPVNVPFDFYLVADVDYADVGEAFQNGFNGIGAWEAEIIVPPNVTILARNLDPVMVNVGSNDNYIVGSPILMKSGSPAVLVHYEAILLGPVEDVVLTIGAASPSSFDDAGSLAEGPGWLEWLATGECDYSARSPNHGCLRTFDSWEDNRLVVNCIAEPECTNVSTREASWSAVKARF